MDKDNFEEIVKSFTPKLYNYILKFVRQREDAEDILQSVFIAFYAKMEGIDENKISSYLYRACHNNSLDFLKKNKREISFPTLDFSNIADMNSEDKENMYEDIVKYAMAEIPAKMSQLIEMKIYQKMSYKEIAEETSYSVKAIESLLVRAKKKLKKIIEKKAKSDLGIIL